MSKFLVEFQSQVECDAFMAGVKFVESKDATVIDCGNLWCLIEFPKEEDNLTYKYVNGRTSFKSLGAVI